VATLFARALLVAAATLLAIGFGPAVAPAGAAPPTKTDVMFVFDTSGSMEGVLNEAKEEIKTLITNTEASLPNAEFGVANVEDVPNYYDGTLEPAFNKEGDEVPRLSESEYEEDHEKPWHLWQPLTSDGEEVEQAINNLSEGEVAHGGGDAPEAYGRALWETATNPKVGWRAGARHEIVLIGDQVPHAPNLNEGIPSAFQLTEPGNDGFETWPDTGEELGGRWGIPETKWKEGESLEFHKTLQKLAAEEKPLAMVDYFHTYTSEKENYIHYWEYWAAETGGQAINADEGSKSLDAKLTEIIKESSEGIPPCQPGYSRTATTPCVPNPPTPTPSPAPPTLAATSPPTVLTTTSAAFTTTVNPEGLETEVHFEYGPVLGGAHAASTGTITYGSVTPDQPVGAGFSNQTVTTTVTGLLPNVTYNVRAVASNSAGSATGANQTLVTPADPPPPPPVLGKAVNVTPVSGIVYIELPPGATLASAASVSPFSPFAPGAQAVEALTKGQAFIPLTEARQIPVGSILETTGGVVGITTATTASRKGKLQTGDFGAGIFKLLQNRKQKGLTDLNIIDNHSASQVCASVGKGKGKGKAYAAKLSSKTLGRVNASGHGHFAVRGQYSAATVRGTVWNVSNRCEGTLTHVTRGVVSVRDFVRRKTITLFTGQSYLAKPRRR
jgi:hypothetical protein